MFKRNTIIVLSLMLIVSLFAGCGGSSNQGDAEGTPKDKKIIMKIAHAGPPNSERDVGAQKIQEIVERKTDGQVEVQIYPASQIGGDADLIQGMQMNTVEMVILPSSFLGGFEPLTTIMDLPFFLPDDYKKLIEIEQGEAGETLRATTDHIGVKTLDIWHAGYKIFTSNKPLNKPEYFKGLKFRTMPSPIQIAMYETFGATPINMDFSECYNALQTEAINGQDNPISVTFDMKFHEVQEVATLTRHSDIAFFIMVSKEWFENLPQVAQDAIVEGVKEGRLVSLDRTLEVDKAALAAFKAKGMEVIELTPEEREGFVDVSKGLQQLYVDKYGKDAEDLLKLFRESIEAVTK